MVFSILVSVVQKIHEDCDEGIPVSDNLRQMRSHVDFKSTLRLAQFFADGFDRCVGDFRRLGLGHK